MSYARPGELGSDVYVYRTGPTLVCHWHNETFEVDTEKEMIDHLQSHVRRGHHVPREAFDRLEAEMAGLPYETPVERELKAMKAIPAWQWHLGMLMAKDIEQ